MAPSLSSFETTAEHRQAFAELQGTYRGPRVPGCSTPVCPYCRKPAELSWFRMPSAGKGLPFSFSCEDPGHFPYIRGLPRARLTRSGSWLLEGHGA